MSHIVLFQQVSLADVEAHIDSHQLDVEAFSARTEQGLVKSLAMSDSALEEAGVEDGWRELAKSLRRDLLAHPEFSHWVTIQNVLRKKPAFRYAHIVQPPHLRTLQVILEKPRGWDFRPMPADDIGTEGTKDGLLEALGNKIGDSVGGIEFLQAGRAPPEARALGLLSTTLKTVLGQDICHINDHHNQRRFLRPDIYERAAEAMGLIKYFRFIRRLLELDHPEHIRVEAEWPTPTSPVRDIGFLRYVGQRQKYLSLA
jgi:hypothetical protein